MAVAAGAHVTPKCIAAIDVNSADAGELPAALGEASIVGHLRAESPAAAKHLHAGVTAVAGKTVVP